MTVETAKLIPAEAEQFAETLRSRLIQPTDPGYDEARSVWNGMIDRRPALIAQCSGTADVIAAVNFAREHDLQLSIKGGGHHVAGTAICDDGLVIDLSAMNGVTVDPEQKTARVQAGATVGDLDHESQAFGLATSLGTCSETGVAGLTLGGGWGFLGSKYGLTIDNLLSADVVTADGRLVHASESEHPDLFWALRGGGGNFGVVTSFEFQLHRVGPDVLTAQIFYRFEDAVEVLQFYRDFMAGAPDEVTAFAPFLRIPPMEPFPEEFHGQIAVGLLACYAGEIEAGEKALAPLEQFGDPILKMIAPMAYTTLQQSFDAGSPHGARYHWEDHMLEELSNDAIDTIVDCIHPLPGDLTIVNFARLGGAIERLDTGATAFPHRDAAYEFFITAGWLDPENDDEVINWAREVHQAMAPYSTGGAYMNMLSADKLHRSRAAYGDNYQRLAEIKRTWDPNNLFSINHNITPSERGLDIDDSSADPATF